MIGATACSEARLAIHTAKAIAGTNDDAVEPHYKIGTPYKIKGKWYYPRVQPDYREEGTASWYGPTFHGKQTANGEVFDRYGMTAAHRTLPMPTLVRVTNLDNGRSIALRVNDRGPFVDNRIIDVSESAATALGFRSSGLANVRVEVITLEEAENIANETPSGQQTASQPPKGTFVAKPVEISAEEKNGVVAVPVSNVKAVTLDPPAQTQADHAGKLSNGPEIQVGAFQDETNARQLGTLVAAHGPVKITSVKVHERDYWRVRLGPFENQIAAQNALDGLRADGYAHAQIIRGKRNR
ncbi:MAG: septal ring lytic transglycosylase RlpA family protein [Alphaproteobacteria bacterium]